MKKLSYQYNYIPSYFYSIFKKYSYFLISLISLILFFSICFYLIACFLFIYYVSDFSIVDKIFSVMLLVSLSFWGVHCVGYIDHLLKSVLMYISPINDDPPLDGKMQPKVAIFIPVFNEEPKIVGATIAKTALINYSSFEIFLLDDSTDAEIHNALVKLGERFNINYIYRKNRRGYKAGAINDAIKNLDNDVKYFLVLDVDHRPKPAILKEVIPFLEEDTSLTFIQTPQYFTSETKDKLSLAYSFQQHIFHKHVCRGLNINNAVFMCGTNVIIRLDHLKEIGGMDETCITEDIVTSFIFHSKGYKSLYLDQVYAEGMSPASLSAYFTQQMRWAYGTIQNLKNVLLAFFKSPQSLKPGQWWEYIVLNGSWYFLGWTLLLWLIYPIAVLLFGVRPLILGSVNTSFLIFIVMIGSQFFTSMRERGYRIGDLFLAQGLFFSLFSTYIRASVYALVGKKLDFKVTPKGRTKTISFVQLCPQFLMLGSLIISIILGLWRIVTRQITTPQIYVTLCWAIYSATILLFVPFFYLEEIKKEKEYEDRNV